jgi:hypothetical protein
MEKKTAGLVGALAGLASMGVAQAASHPAPPPAPIMQAASYADLLKPIPNAAEVLRKAQAQPGVEEAQYYNNQPPPYYHHHHHHHHHHAYYPPPPPPPYYHHHHHHHHQGGVTIVVPGLGIVHSN